MENPTAKLTVSHTDRSEHHCIVSFKGRHNILLLIEDALTTEL
jgi:hypothetical protein